jgi:hypothetical protein
MGNIEHQRGKNKPAHRGGGDDAHKQHAPSRHHGEGEAEPRRGSHREQRPAEPPETDFPNQERSPSEEFINPDDDRD